jgi:hypothetical protein
MNAIREALVLPGIFLTVVLLAALNPGTRVAFVAPSLFALILGVLLVSALVRSGALAPDALLHGSRSVLANANGAIVLASLFAAVAQVLSVVTPASGLPLFFVDVFLFVLLLNTLVTQPDRRHVLRGIAVILGSALVLKFVVLAQLGDPAGTRMRRVLVALFDAATFGSVTQDPQPAVAGYLAFAAIVLFLIGVALLPRRAELRPALPVQSPGAWA